MKVTVKTALLSLWILTLVGCSPSAGSSSQAEAVSGGSASVTHETVAGPPSGGVVEITERLFIAQTNDIYINPDDYMDKTIQYEGIFISSYWEETDTTYRFVLRYGPGCCGYDGTAGFEVTWDGMWPKDDDWCEVAGTLEWYEENGSEYLRLRLSSLTVLEERGAEFVST